MALGRKNDKFTKDDLKPGYVVKLRNGSAYVVAQVGNRGALIITGNMVAPDWHYLSHWNHDLTAKEYVRGGEFSVGALEAFDITEVYGYVCGLDAYRAALWPTTEHRPLLWAQNRVVRVTISEIEKMIGAKVEIVSEGD